MNFKTDSYSFLKTLGIKNSDLVIKYYHINMDSLGLFQLFWHNKSGFPQDRSFTMIKLVLPPASIAVSTIPQDQTSTGSA